MAFVGRFNKPGTWDKGRAMAQANANNAGLPFLVFVDTSGNVRVERFDASNPHTPPGCEVFYPQK